MAISGTDPNLYMSYSSDNNNLNGHQSRRLPIGSFSWNQVVRGESELIAATIASQSSASIASQSSAATSSSSSATVVESLPSPGNTLFVDESQPSQSTILSSPVENSSTMGDSLESDNCYNGNMVKRPAWDKPSNGAVSEVKPVMGADSWPALSKSTRNKLKSSVLLKDSTEELSVSHLQVTTNTPSSSERQIGDDANTNNVAAPRQNSAKSDGSSASSDSSHAQQSAPQTPTAATGSHNSSPKDHTHRIGSVPQSHNVKDQPQQHIFRNRNSGSYPRGDGSHHHNYGSRREQGRGSQDWNTHRNFNGRDTYTPQRNFQRFPRPPHPRNPLPFFQSPPLPPFVRPVGYHEPVPQVFYYAPSQDSGFFYVPSMPPHAMVPPAPNLQLHTKIVTQIDYYFSPDNLIKDTYLRQKMDNQGWVSIELIAGFGRVKSLTDNIQLILEALRTSSVVEVQGDKVRRRNDWGRWILSTAVEFPRVMTSQTHGKSSQEAQDMLAEQVRRVSLAETNKNAVSDGQPEGLRNGPSSGDLNSPVQHCSGEEKVQVGIQASDDSVAARNPL